MRAATLFAVLSLILSSPAAAGPAVSFEAALGNIRSTVLKTRASQIQTKTAATESEIRRLTRSLDRKDWDVRRLKNRLSDLRRRAQRLDRNGRGRGSDAFFNNDLRRLVWDLRDLKRDIERDGRTMTRILRSAIKDPALVSPAQRLEREARSLESETGWLENEARWARMDIQRAGYNFEAWDIERYSDDIDRDVRDIRRDARRLIDKVR